MSAAEGLYRRLPRWAQHGAVSTYGVYWRWLRFGPGYRRDLDAYRSREKLDGGEFDRWTRNRLREVLAVAARVPYYRETWDGAAHEAAKEGRLEGLPLLEKDPLRADAHAFVRQDRPSRQLVFHTSGSTGTPIATVWTVAELRRSLALREARSAGWAGTSFRQPRATFSGRMVEPDPESVGPFYRFNAAERQVYFSAFHLSADTVDRYVEALRKHRIRWLTGYAVSLYLMARFARERSLTLPPLDAIVTTSEKLTADMREVMETVYGCRVFEEYSTVENAVFASECERGGLHLSTDAGLVELLRPDGTPCDPGEPGEVVATCLLRDQQPLIRFRLGDVATWADGPCPCRRPLPLLAEVVGRTEDVVVAPDGRAMVRFHGVFVDLPHVREGQVIQEALDRIRVKVVAAEGYGPQDTEVIVARIHQRLGPGVTVDVEPVARIPRTAAGKFQAVVSRLAAGDRPS